MENCERKSEYRPTDWKQIDLYEEQARVLASELDLSIMQGEKISWNELKEICLMDMTLWKLLLKEFRSRGYSIGHHGEQNVAKK